MLRHKILIVASRKSIGDSLQKILKRNRFAVLFESDIKRASQSVREHDPDLIILDMVSPKWSGWDVARRLRRVTEAPIVAVGNVDSLSTEGNEIDAQLETPVTSRKLLKQVRTLLARPRYLYSDVLTLDLKRREVWVGGSKHQMTPKEFALLKALMSNAGTVLSRKTIMRTVWNTDFLADTRTLDVHIRWIREKIEEYPGKPSLVRTVRGVGYLFVPTEVSSSNTPPEPLIEEVAR
ncbi:MAG: response regulator transcription factor [Chloroflexi bacterium]|nr:response regulator transcription factor [Chloroflexota bacterium]